MDDKQDHGPKTGHMEISIKIIVQFNGFSHCEYYQKAANKRINKGWQKYFASKLVNVKYTLNRKQKKL